VEFAKTVHACRATATFDYASSKLLRDVPFLQAEPDSPYFHAGVARTQPRPFFPSPTTMFAQKSALPSKQNHNNKKDLQKGP